MITFKTKYLPWKALRMLSVRNILQILNVKSLHKNELHSLSHCIVKHKILQP